MSYRRHDEDQLADQRESLREYAPMGKEYGDRSRGGYDDDEETLYSSRKESVGAHDAAPPPRPPSYWDPAKYRERSHRDPDDRDLPLPELSLPYGERERKRELDQGPTRQEDNVYPRDRGHSHQGASYRDEISYRGPTCSEQRVVTAPIGRSDTRPDRSAPATPKLPSIRELPDEALPQPVPRYRGTDTASEPVTSITQQLEKQRLTSFYVRPGFGGVGKPLTVLSNFFSVRTKTDDGKGRLIYHYDVDVNPVVHVLNQKKPKGLIRAVWEQLCFDYQDNASGERKAWAEALGASAFDGRRNCFTPVPLPIPEGHTQTLITAITTDGVVHRPGHGSSSDDDSKRWKVAIKFAAMIDLEAVMRFCRADQQAPTGEEDCLTAVMATNVLLRDVPSKNYAQVGATGNRFFTLDGALPIPQGGVVCRGFMQSFRYSNSGLPLLNLDVGVSAFLAHGPAVEVIAKMLNRDRGGGGGRGRGGPGGYHGGIPRASNDLSELSKEEIGMVKNKLRGAKFTVTHRQSSRLHTIMSVTLLPAEDIIFQIQNKNGVGEKKISITDYYREYYSAPVTKPRLPCIQYGKKAYIPLEFVNLEKWNSLPPTKLTAEQYAQMSRISAIAPKDRVAQTIDWRSKLAYEKQPKIAKWGLQVNTNMIEISARILPPPRVLYANNREARTADGGWHLRGQRFFRNGKKPLVAWACISFDRYFDKDDMKRYITYMCEVLIAHGVDVQNKTPALIEPTDPRLPGNILNALQRAAQGAFKAGQCTPQLICVVLPGRDAWLYEAIKRASFTDLKGPVPTQCMQATKLKQPRGIDAYTENLVMKVQSKLGGLTHQVPISELPGMIKGKTMLFGADLGHPPIKYGFDSAPTVACSIATWNADCDSFSAQIRLQESREEIIRDLSSMVEEHLKIFSAKNEGELPERILIFRDGISEGQYAAALQYEHDAVLRACAKMQKGYRPRILICICAKSHNTRFFGAKEQDVDRSGNLPNGLVVDRSVTHPYAFDFFMQALAGRLGTTRPTHYICLLDELAITPDQLQQLVHGLCYSFARCTKSVSLVPVCYIADLVCQKARIMVHEQTGTSYAPSQSSAGKTGAGTSADHKRKTVGDIDVMQVQNVLRRNPELADVAWWM